MTVPPSVAPPRAMVFDIGNVLVDWQPGRVYADLIPDPEARAAFFARVDMHGMNLAGDRNGDLAAEVEALALRHPEDAVPIRAWRARWDEMFGPMMPGMETLFRAVKASGVPVAALTNFAADTFLVAQARFPILAEFDVEVVSGREGTLKPEPRIYEIVEARTGLSGPDLFFADDKPENVAAARARGWRGHVFEGAEGLAAAMRAAGFAV
ncbi:MAG: HAD family phosphatase [Pseudomonadota bacterium]|nr:HAD family phosphatase [Pseudomonadota bacterium]